MHSEWPSIASGRLCQDPIKIYYHLFYNVMSQPSHQLPESKEARLQLALQAIQQDTTLSVTRAVAIYEVAERTLRRRRAGTTFRRDCAPNSMRLTIREEEVIVQHILDLDARGFPPRLAAVKDMADSLLAARHEEPVGESGLITLLSAR